MGGNLHWTKPSRRKRRKTDTGIVDAPTRSSSGVVPPPKKPKTPLKTIQKSAKKVSAVETTSKRQDGDGFRVNEKDPSAPKRRVEEIRTVDKRQEDKPVGHKEKVPKSARKVPAVKTPRRRSEDDAAFLKEPPSRTDELSAPQRERLVAADALMEAYTAAGDPESWQREKLNLQATAKSTEVKSLLTISKLTAARESALGDVEKLKTHVDAITKEWEVDKSELNRLRSCSNELAEARKVIQLLEAEKASNAADLLAKKDDDINQIRKQWASSETFLARIDKTVNQLEAERQIVLALEKKNQNLEARLSVTRHELEWKTQQVEALNSKMARASVDGELQEANRAVQRLEEEHEIVAACLPTRNSHMREFERASQDVTAEDTDEVSREELYSLLKLFTGSTWKKSTETLEGTDGRCQTFDVQIESSLNLRQVNFRVAVPITALGNRGTGCADGNEFPREPAEVVYMPVSSTGCTEEMKPAHLKVNSAFPSEESPLFFRQVQDVVHKKKLSNLGV